MADEAASGWSGDDPGQLMVTDASARGERERSRKLLGQYATPSRVVRLLLDWLVRRAEDAFLDPACGDGRFLSHEHSTGVDCCGVNCALARERAPHARVHRVDFFEWAAATSERFDAVGGNPPFIRYQNFTGEIRRRASALSASLGASFSGLASSWAPFLVVAASMLRPGGRLGFVVPAEIGHSTYAGPLLTFLCRHFESVTVLALREKLFPRLSEDAWLVYAGGYGDGTEHIGLAVRDTVADLSALPPPDLRVPLPEWVRTGRRLRKYVLPRRILEHYDHLLASPDVVRVGEVAGVSVGYVTGANDFFHLRPSRAERLGIPRDVLRVAVRKSEHIPGPVVDAVVVGDWLARDLPVLLLDLSGVERLPGPVLNYLDSSEGVDARRRYKCRVRAPWYVVPGVTVPDAFMSCMSGGAPLLARNAADCVCTNSVLAVRLRAGVALSRLQSGWAHPLSRLSQELEGHALGGGMLKLEPGEAERIAVPLTPERLPEADEEVLMEGVDIALRWRHLP